MMALGWAPMRGAGQGPQKHDRHQDAALSCLNYPAYSCWPERYRVHPPAA